MKEVFLTDGYKDYLFDPEGKWPGERLYTYVNSHKIRSTNPGYCFLRAGWRKCGMTKGGLIILEKLA